MQQLVVGLQGAPLVALVADPLQTGAVNPAKTLALIQVNYSVGAGDITPEAREALIALAETADGRADRGGRRQRAPGAAAPGAAEAIGVLIAAIVLVLTLGSLVAAGLPLLTALLGIGIGLSARSPSRPHFFDARPRSPRRWR